MGQYVSLEFDTDFEGNVYAKKYSLSHQLNVVSRMCSGINIKQNKRNQNKQTVQIQ